MTESEFTNYINQLIPNFARELEGTGEITNEEALTKSRKIVNDLLPHGLNTRDHYLFTVRSCENHQTVGILYIAFQENITERSVFIYDIEIFEPFRGKGFGEQAMRLVEEFAVGLGGSEVWLHVFANNAAAIHLYKKLGYENKKEFIGKDGQVTSRRMAKSLAVGSTNH